MIEFFGIYEYNGFIRLAVMRYYKEEIKTA